MTKMVGSTSRREYLNEWRKRKRAEDVLNGLSTPVPEGKARRRVCRVCALPVETKSYWYCHDHNILSGEGEDNEYSTCLNVESWD